MAALAALCKPHSASEQKLSTPVHSTLLYDFALAHCLSASDVKKFEDIGPWENIFSD